MKRIELYTAFEWICDECGKGNFESAVDAGIVDDDGEKLVLAPEEVTCRHCNVQYETYDSDWTGEDDEQSEETEVC